MLQQAREAVALAHDVFAQAVAHIKEDGPDSQHDQALLYQLSHTAASLAMCETALEYGSKGTTEERLAHIFIGKALHEFAAIVWVAHERWGISGDALDDVRRYCSTTTQGDFIAEAANRPGTGHLRADLTMVAETFRRFADEQIMPVAEAIHRHDNDIPQDLIDGVAALGCFGLSINEQYGGSASGREDDYLAMVIATEELSRGSLGAGGSLITRPEILARALEAGGTNAQKAKWLPRLASGESLCAVAVTEPDFGSDVASLSVMAAPTDGGWLLNGTKTWCTFAGRATVLMVLARTNNDVSIGHRGLSLLLVEKPADLGHTFRHEIDGGTMGGRAIPTLGYRGMHSFEVVFDNWFVPAANLVGEEAGLGRGFYLQMAGFENGRLQTTARSVGLMQRAYELAVTYAADRKVFGSSLDTYQLTNVKLGTMAALIQISRQFSYQVARQMAMAEGAADAAMAKAFVCKAAEWVAREAMQIHGGYGYAEEYEVSRLYVDARVLSIFEGADEVLCLKLIARRLLA